jgi:hypothetical protein
MKYSNTIKNYASVLSLALALSGCGSSADSGAVVNPQDGNTFYVNSASELPECSSSRVNQLWYIADSQTFRSCSSGGWIDVSIGRSIVSNQIMSADPTDFCTAYAAESCVFRGGQIVTFSDGSVMLMGGFEFFSFDGVSDSNSDMNSVTFIVPKTVDYAYLLLNPTVARTGTSGYRSLYLVWSREDEEAILVFDINNNQIVDSADVKVLDIVLSDFS